MFSQNQTDARRWWPVMFIVGAIYLIGIAFAGALSGRTPSTGSSTAMMHPSTHAALTFPVEGELPSFDGATTWLNSPPLKPSELRGKVVLVDFWTYSCINWRRTLPYLRAWSDKYKDQGLVVIGVHSPEFEFEKNISNVQQAIKEMSISYPVAIDSDHAIWRAFDNQYWPALYFVDAQGHIRYHQFGEGEYDQAELVIQQLLTEAGHTGFNQHLVPVDAQGVESPADWNDLRSPENYLGFERTENFSSPGGAKKGSSHDYTAPLELRVNQWGLSGNWNVGRQSIVLNQANGRIVYRFHARDLHLVMGPAAQGKSVRFRVLIDGHSPGAAHGSDVDDQGYGTVSEQRLYQLIRQPAPIIDRLFEIEFLDAGAEAFSFTFG